MSDSVTIRVPIDPPAELLPNRRHRRGGFYPGIEAAATARQMAYHAAIPYATAVTIDGPVALTVHASYGHGRKVPDLDATLSACKPMIDGIVDTRLLADDRQVTRITVLHSKLAGKRGERPQGWTDITLEELA